MKSSLLYPLILATLGSLCLPSCTQWQLGEVIRGDTEHFRYYSIDDELIDTVYELKPGAYYAKLPEMSSTIEIRNAYFNFGEHSKLTSKHYRSPAKATGESQWVLITEKTSKKNRLKQTTRNITRLPGQPSLAGTTAKKFKKPEYMDRWQLENGLNTLSNNEDRIFLTYTKRQDKTTTWEYIAAAPFDYCIDPALTLVTTPTLIALAIPAALIIAPSSMLYAQVQEEEPPPPPVLAPVLAPDLAQ